MQTELFTVSRIFTESLYRIPDYQRGYSWGTNQLRDFWLDIEQLQSGGKHYTGVLTLEDVPAEKWKHWEDDVWIIESRRYKPYYVVDGQQRLTTVIILLQCILEKSGSDRLNYTSIGDIRRKYVFDSKLEDSARSYIFGYEKDNPSYEFLKKRIFLEDSDVHLTDEVTIYTKNLLASKEFFNEQIKDMKSAELESLFTKITQQLVFNVYEISSDIDVFVTFETMNNRGKLLSTLELLKNRLIFLSTKLRAPSGREGVLRRRVNDAWKAAYHYLGKNDERPLTDDEFLQTQLSYFYLTKLSKLKDKADAARDKAIHRFVIAIEEFNRYLLNELFTPKRIGEKTPSSDELPALTREFISDFSQHIKDSVERYYKLSTPSDSEFTDAEKIQLERIGRLVGHSPSPLLMAVYSKEKRAEKRVRFLEQFERNLFCNSIGFSYQPRFVRRRINTPEHYLTYTTGSITIDELTTMIENMTTEMFREMPLHETLNEWVREGGGYYGWRAIRYFLYEYELSLKEGSKSGREKLNWRDFSRENYQDDFETVEHIYPQRAKDPYWAERFSKFNTAQKRLLRNSLGNLLPLSRPRNSSLGNRSFPEKIGDDKSKTGYRYGCYSEVEVAGYDEWNADNILQRGLRLLTFMEKRWKLTIGDNAVKARALGLGFLNKP